MVDKMCELTYEYLFPSQITKATLNTWIFECIAECVEWEAEFSTEEKDGGSKKGGQDNMPFRCRRQHRLGPTFPRAQVPSAIRRCGGGRHSGARSVCESESELRRAAMCNWHSRSGRTRVVPPHSGHRRVYPSRSLA